MANEGALAIAALVLLGLGAKAAPSVSRAVAPPSAPTPAQPVAVRPPPTRPVVQFAPTAVPPVSAPTRPSPPAPPADTVAPRSILIVPTPAPPTPAAPSPPAPQLGDKRQDSSSPTGWSNWDGSQWQPYTPLPTEPGYTEPPPTNSVRNPDGSINYIVYTERQRLAQRVNAMGGVTIPGSGHIGFLSYSDIVNGTDAGWGEIAAALGMSAAESH